MITIGIATYNRPRTLKTLLMVLLPVAKKWKLEVIVANDGGEGGKGIEGFMNGFIKTVGNGKVFNNRENKGIFEIRKQLLNAATTDWMYFLDDDDLPNILALDHICQLISDGKFEPEEGTEPIDIISSGILEFHYGANGGLGLHSKFDYYRPKTRITQHLNGNVINLGKLRGNLHLYEEAIKDRDRTINIGEDGLLMYHIAGRKRDLVAYLIDGEPLTLMDYSTEDEHMSGKGKQHLYIPGLNSIRPFSKNTLDKTKSYL